MLHVMRHNLRLLVRLAALLVLLGLGTVPVECAAVYGPHSVFLSAEAVAALRASGTEAEAQAAPAPHVHGAQPSAASAMDMEMDAAADAPVASAPGALHGTEAVARGSVPATAGAMTDALISMAPTDVSAGIAAGVPAPLPIPASPPVSHVAPAPEPPPP